MKPLVIATVILLTSAVFAGDYNTEINKFFTLFEQGKKVEAVDTIYATNPWMSTATDAINNIKTQFEGIEKLVGDYNGKERISERNIKDRFVHVTYLALYDRQPVRMEFQFYRPKTDWIIYSFSFDIDFDDEIEAGARQRIASGTE